VDSRASEESAEIFGHRICAAGIVVDQAECDIAPITQDAANSARIVIMINVGMFRLLERATTYRTTPTLIVYHHLLLIWRKAVFF
jgi:hypothetical protein